MSERPSSDVPMCLRIVGHAGPCSDSVDIAEQGTVMRCCVTMYPPTEAAALRAQVAVLEDALSKANDGFDRLTEERDAAAGMWTLLEKEKNAQAAVIVALTGELAAARDCGWLPRENDDAEENEKCQRCVACLTRIRAELSDGLRGWMAEAKEARSRVAALTQRVADAEKTADRRAEGWKAADLFYAQAIASADSALAAATQRAEAAEGQREAAVRQAKTRNDLQEYTAQLNVKLNAALATEKARADALLAAEHSTSDAYVRLRVKLDALVTPMHRPTAEQVWAHTEAKLDNLTAALAEERAKGVVMADRQLHVNGCARALLAILETLLIGGKARAAADALRACLPDAVVVESQRGKP